MDWAREHPPQAIGIVAGSLAFLRLIAISHGRLGTARALLEHADLVGLAGGLVISAALVWVPFCAGVLAFAALGAQKNPDIAGWIGIGAGFATLFGAIAYWDWHDPDPKLVAHGGPSFLILAIGFGVGVGSFLHPILRHPAPATVKTTGQGGRRNDAETASAEHAEVGATAGEPDGRAVEQESTKGRASEPMAASSTPGGWWDALGRGLGRTFGALMALFGFIMTLAAAAIVAFMVGWVLSEPSQPPENLTVSSAGVRVTETVHVLDDDGDQWLVMRRSDRTIRSVDSRQVTDRYVCRPVNIDARITTQVRLAGFGSMWGRTSNRKPARPSEIKNLSSGDDYEADSAREWIEAVLNSPPPCEMEFSSTELQALRADLGYDCHQLMSCEQRPDPE